MVVWVSWYVISIAVGSEADMLVLPVIDARSLTRLQLAYSLLAVE